MSNLNLRLPTNIEINTREDNRTFIQIPNTKFWVVGEKKTGDLWDIFLVDPEKNDKEILRKNTATAAFVIFCNVVLKSPFPTGKREPTINHAKLFIKKLTKTKAYGIKRNRHNSYKRS